LGLECKVLVNESDYHRALSDRTGNALNRAVANIACTEEAGKIRFKVERRATCFPLAKIRDVAARENEAFLIALNSLREPSSGSVGPDHDTEYIRLSTNHFIVAVLRVDRLETMLPRD